MWAIIKTWLSGNALRLISWGVAGLSVLTVLLGARQAGRNAERVDQLKQVLEVKDAQLRATLDARSGPICLDRIAAKLSYKLLVCVMPLVSCFAPRGEGRSPRQEEQNFVHHKPRPA